MNPVYVPDPYVLRVGKEYFLYAASVNNGEFTVRKSTDLKNWGESKVVFQASEDSWSRDCYWAPECHVIHGKYCLFYSANQKCDLQHETFRIGVAISDSPDGLFLPLENRPIFDPGYPIIDASILVDGDHIYLYYSRCCDQHLVGELEESWIYVVELDDTLMKTIGQPCLLLKPTEEWESRSLHTGRRWTEGPFVIKHHNKFYMTYSSNFYMEKEYAIGYAISDSPLGPFVKAPKNPIVYSTENITGPGHGCFIQYEDKLVAIFHGRTAETGINRVSFFTDAFFDHEKLCVDIEHANMMMEE